MARLHLAVRNFPPEVIQATDRLFESKPWRGEDSEKHDKFQQWLNEASAYYGVVPKPELEVDSWMHLLVPDPTRLTIPKYSVATMFTVFADRFLDQLQTEGVSGVEWSYSLFYAVRPRLFRKAVRRGQLVGDVHPEDLLNPNTPMGMCQHCEGNIFETGERWRHVETGWLHCATFDEAGDRLAGEELAIPIAGAAPRILNRPVIQENNDTVEDNSWDEE